MRKCLTLVTALLSVTLAWSQKEIKIEEIGQHVGDSVKVCAKIYGGIFLERAKGQPTLINVGAAYPEAPLTLIIRPEVRKDFKSPPEDFYKDKHVCIMGKVELYRDKPQITIHNEDQLTVQ
ncbi:MAG: hypothetical protein H7Y42_15855 [Chitinophagaceae bacterium]|nr:hypothetical protein [Chitinophagaceae bacterium]